MRPPNPEGAQRAVEDDKRPYARAYALTQVDGGGIEGEDYVLGVGGQLYKAVLLEGCDRPPGYAPGHQRHPRPWSQERPE